MSAPLPLTIADAAEALRSGQLTSVALTESILDRIAANDAILGAYVTVTGPEALAAAAAADAAFAAGVDHGPLQGIPLAIKDIIATKDAPTTANSRVLDPTWGDGVDAPVVARLRDVGAVLVGKATTSEYACGMPDETKGFPIPRNPWNTDHTPAGSSAGTGIAVAAGLALGGLGTDTGGSVRSPASVNGHTGLKVTFGRVPKSGVVPLGYTHDSVGPMARSAWDCAALLEVMAGYDPSDPYCADVDVPRYTDLLTGSVAGMRIGVPRTYFFDADGLDPEVRDSVLAALSELEAAGATLVDVTIPHADMAKDANTMAFLAEAYAYHRDDLVGRWEVYGCHTRPTIGRAALYNAADFAQAQRFRRWFCRQVANVLSDVDVLVTPTSPTPADRIDAMTVEKRVHQPAFTGQWNFTGMPAVAMPCGFSSSGLPISAQVIGRPFAEGTVLGVADAYQRLTDWHLAVPPIGAAVAA
ncbi:MAG: amidase [Acidimicrobiales bacterium]